MTAPAETLSQALAQTKSYVHDLNHQQTLEAVKSGQRQFRDVSDAQHWIAGLGFVPVISDSPIDAMSGAYDYAGVIWGQDGVLPVTASVCPVDKLPLDDIKAGRASIYLGQSMLHDRSQPAAKSFITEAELRRRADEMIDKSISDARAAGNESFDDIVSFVRADIGRFVNPPPRTYVQEWVDRRLKSWTVDPVPFKALESADISASELSGVWRHRDGHYFFSFGDWADDVSDLEERLRDVMGESVEFCDDTEGAPKDTGDWTPVHSAPRENKSSAAGEKEGHPFRGNQYKHGQAEPKLSELPSRASAEDKKYKPANDIGEDETVLPKAPVTYGGKNYTMVGNSTGEHAKWFHLQSSAQAHADSMNAKFKPYVHDVIPFTKKGLFSVGRVMSVKSGETVLPTEPVKAEKPIGGGTDVPGNMGVESQGIKVETKPSTWNPTPIDFIKNAESIPPKGQVTFFHKMYTAVPDGTHEHAKGYSTYELAQADANMLNSLGTTKKQFVPLKLQQSGQYIVGLEKDPNEKLPEKVVSMLIPGTPWPSEDVILPGPGTPAPEVYPTKTKPSTMVDLGGESKKGTPKNPFSIDDDMTNIELKPGMAFTIEEGKEPAVLVAKPGDKSAPYVFKPDNLDQAQSAVEHMADKYGPWFGMTPIKSGPGSNSDVWAITVMASKWSPGSSSHQAPKPFGKPQEGPPTKHIKYPADIEKESGIKAHDYLMTGDKIYDVAPMKAGGSAPALYDSADMASKIADYLSGQEHGSPHTVLELPKIKKWALVTESTMAKEIEAKVTQPSAAAPENIPEVAAPSDEEPFEELPYNAESVGNLADKIATKIGVPKEKIYKALSSHADPSSQELASIRVKVESAILKSHTAIKDAVQHVNQVDDPKEKNDLLEVLTTGDVKRAQKEYEKTPIYDLQCLSKITVYDHPVQGQANCNLESRTVNMGSTSVTGDFRHELGHAIHGALGATHGKDADNAVLATIAKHYDTVKAAMKAHPEGLGTGKPGEPGGKMSHQWYQENYHIIGRRGADNWLEDFAELYRGYHKAAYMDEAQKASGLKGGNLDDYRKWFPSISRIFDARYTAALIGRMAKTGEIK